MDGEEGNCGGYDEGRRRRRRSKEERRREEERIRGGDNEARSEKEEEEGRVKRGRLLDLYGLRYYGCIISISRRAYCAILW